MNTILITGATGFLGNHTVRVLKKIPNLELITVSSSDYNLLDERSVKKMFIDTKPEYVVHLAARSGGIYSNRTEPADYYYKNLMLITLTMHFAYKFKVKKILVPIGGCSYPATVTSPIVESDMWNGFAQEQSAGYSMAKKMSIVQSWAYRKQYGFNSSIIVPGNMYGEFDNFSLTDSHVIPAMIRKFYEAKRKKTQSLKFWGTGAPRRDFVYAGDVAKLIPYFLFDYNSDDPVNISTSTDVSIKDLADLIARKVGYNGKIEWDHSQPDGQLVKIFNTEKLAALGLKCETDLKTGISKTVNWFNDNYPKNIRL